MQGPRFIYFFNMVRAQNWHVRLGACRIQNYIGGILQTLGCLSKSDLLPPATSRDMKNVTSCQMFSTHRREETTQRSIPSSCIFFADRHRCFEPPGTSSFGHTKEYITSRLSEAAMDVLHPSEE